MPGLGTSFGRGGATTAPSDLVNSDAILIMGSNMAENHPVGFQWVIEARERGAKVIHVDPRFSRTSAMANIWAPLRAGSDILFLGGLIRYVLENKKEFRDYVIHYTNASSILPEDFKDTEDVEGVFSGWGCKESEVRFKDLVLRRVRGASQTGGAGRLSRLRPQQRGFRNRRRSERLRARPDTQPCALGLSGPQKTFRTVHA